MTASVTGKLTKPQRDFLERACKYGFTAVWPGSYTRVANNLQRLGLITISNDVARPTASARNALRQEGA
jgi:hypothetical protein